jgi:hypothetical protein
MGRAGGRRGPARRTDGAGRGRPRTSADRGAAEPYASARTTSTTTTIAAITATK